jgi:hypothetical protein
MVLKDRTDGRDERGVTDVSYIFESNLYRHFQQ